MTSALLYRSEQHRAIWYAGAGAVLLHLAAIAFAAGRSPSAADFAVSPFGLAIEGEPEPQATPEPIDLPPPPPALTDDTGLPEENLPPAKPRNPKVVSPIRRSNTIFQRGLTSVKAFALSAPRPAYPYEARRQRITGSGTALLEIDARTGQVTEARMSQSTGSSILDNATVSALRQWRFKIGTPPTVTVPITFTLTGATY
jgi:TonB family protein